MIGTVALHFMSWRVREHKEQVISHYQNHLYGLVNHHKHIWYCFGDLQVAYRSIIILIPFYTGAKIVAGTCSPLWPTRLLDAWSCSFTHTLQQLTLLAVIRTKTLCQAQPPWRHNAIPWWHHIQNIASFWNLELDMLSKVKTMGKYWLNYVVLTSWDEYKTAYLHDMVHQTSLRESAAWADLWSARRLLTFLGRSGGPYHIKTEFYYCMNQWKV